MVIESELALGLALPAGVFVYLCWTIDEPGARHWAAATVAFWLAALGGSMESPALRTAGLCLGMDVSILSAIGAQRFLRRPVSKVLTVAVWVVPLATGALAAGFDLSTAFGVGLFVDTAFYAAIVWIVCPLSRVGISRPERLLPLLFVAMLPVNAFDLWTRATGEETFHSAVTMAGIATAIGLAQLFALVHRVVERERAARNLVEDEVRLRTAELEQTLRTLRHRERLASIGTLAAGVAHQLNNPIGAIVLAATATEPDAASGRSEILRSKEIETIREQAERCRRIVRGIMRFARSEPTARSPCDLVAVIGTAIAQVESHARGAKASVRFEARVDGKTEASGPDLEEAFVNVLRNAIESRPEGAAVHVTLDRDERAFFVSIADDGRGIAQEDLDHVVEPFYSTRIRSGGTGLGLSVAHGVVASHDGALDVESEVGVGTTVTIRLPR
ncbi:MAG: HAMP domain-containing sensor histidine kinase [Myxococcota bacterium]